MTEQQQAEAIAAVLNRAADSAGAQLTFMAARRVGWSACHADRDLINEVFETWARSEDVSYLSDLGGVIGKRYKTPADVAASLRRAAGFARPSGGER